VAPERVRVKAVGTVRAACQQLKIWVKLLPPVLKIKSSPSQSQSASASQFA